MRAGTPFAFAIAALVISPAQAQLRPTESPLAIDLSAHLIAVTSSFTGAELLLYGTIEEPGEVVLVIRGPSATEVVRRKGRFAGLWVNQRSIEFANVPGYHAVIASRPLTDIAPPSLWARLQIGADNVRLMPAGADSQAAAPFRDAILRDKTRHGLYRANIGQLTFQGRKLFRARVEFPSEVPVGTYRAEAYLIAEERVVAAQAVPLFIDKQGVEQAVSDLARQRPHLYGLVAVLGAILAGGIASTIFRRS
jgi:uncharacterized protein (TIGR02186 family)